MDNAAASPSAAAATSRSSAVKRLMKELAELRASPSPEFVAEPLEDNLLEWHFSLRGPPEGGFEGGRYHGRLIFPPEYPFKPPHISFLTPNGRFEVGKKICLSITSYHPEFWRPAWGVRTAIVAIISFFPTRGDGAIGALDWSEHERQVCAQRSRDWSCPTCGAHMQTVLPDESVAPTVHYDADPDIVLSVRDSVSAPDAPSGSASASGYASGSASASDAPQSRDAAPASQLHELSDPQLQAHVASAPTPTQTTATLPQEGTEAQSEHVPDASMSTAQLQALEMTLERERLILQKLELQIKRNGDNFKFLVMAVFALMFAAMFGSFFV